MEDINAIIAKSKHDIPRLHNYVEFIVSTLSDVIHNEGESESDFIIKTNKIPLLYFFDKDLNENINISVSHRNLFINSLVDIYPLSNIYEKHIINISIDKHAVILYPFNYNKRNYVYLSNSGLGIVNQNTNTNKTSCKLFHVTELDNIDKIYDMFLLVTQIIDLIQNFSPIDYLKPGFKIKKEELHTNINRKLIKIQNSFAKGIDINVINKKFLSEFYKNILSNSQNKSNYIGYINLIYLLLNYLAQADFMNECSFHHVLDGDDLPIYKQIIRDLIYNHENTKFTFNELYTNCIIEYNSEVYRLLREEMDVRMPPRSNDFINDINKKLDEYAKLQKTIEFKRDSIILELHNSGLYNYVQVGGSCVFYCFYNLLINNLFLTNYSLYTTNKQKAIENVINPLLYIHYTLLEHLCMCNDISHLNSTDNFYPNQIFHMNYIYNIMIQNNLMEEITNFYPSPNLMIFSKTPLIDRLLDFNLIEDRFIVKDTADTFFERDVNTLTSCFQQIDTLFNGYLNKIRNLEDLHESSLIRFRNHLYDVYHKIEEAFEHYNLEYCLKYFNISRDIIIVYCYYLWKFYSQNNFFDKYIKKENTINLLYPVYRLPSYIDLSNCGALNDCMRKRCEPDVYNCFYTYNIEYILSKFSNYEINTLSVCLLTYDVEIKTKIRELFTLTECNNISVGVVELKQFNFYNNNIYFELDDHTLIMKRFISKYFRNKYLSINSSITEEQRKKHTGKCKYIIEKLKENIKVNLDLSSLSIFKTNIQDLTSNFNDIDFTSILQILLFILSDGAYIILSYEMCFSNMFFNLMTLMDENTEVIYNNKSNNLILEKIYFFLVKDSNHDISNDSIEQHSKWIRKYNIILDFDDCFKYNGEEYAYDLQPAYNGSISIILARFGLHTQNCDEYILLIPESYLIHGYILKKNITFTFFICIKKTKTIIEINIIDDKVDISNCYLLKNEKRHKLEFNIQHPFLAFFTETTPYLCYTYNNTTYVDIIVSSVFWSINPNKNYKYLLYKPDIDIYDYYYKFEILEFEIAYSMAFPTIKTNNIAHIKSIHYFYPTERILQFSKEQLVSRDILLDYKHINNLTTIIKDIATILCKNINCDQKTNETFKQVFTNELLEEESRNAVLESFLKENRLCIRFDFNAEIISTRSQIEIKLKRINDEIQIIHNFDKPQFIIDNVPNIIAIMEINEIINELFKINMTTSCWDIQSLLTKLDSILLFNEDIKQNSYNLYELLFLFQNNYFFKENQLRKYKNIVSDITTNNRSLTIHQFMMGKGKTSFLTPLLSMAIYLFTGKSSIVITNEHLLSQTINYMRYIHYLGRIPFDVATDYEYKQVWLEKTDIELRKNPKLHHQHNYLTSIDNISNTSLIIDEFNSHYDYTQSMFNLVKKQEYISEEMFNYIFDYIHSKISQKPFVPTEISELESYEIFNNTLDKELAIAITLKYNEKYGFTNILGDIRLCIPYARKDTPLIGSRFSSIILTIILTLNYYITIRNYKLDEKYDYPLIVNNYSDIIKIVPTEIFDEWYESIQKNQNIDIDIIKTTFDKLYSNLDRYVPLLKKILYIINRSGLVFATEQYNVSFQDIIYYPEQWKVGYTGTIYLNPDIYFKDDTFVFKNKIEDFDERIEVKLALQGYGSLGDWDNSVIIINTDIQYTMVAQLRTIISIGINRGIVDIAGLFIDYTNMNIAEELQALLPEKKIVYLSEKHEGLEYSETEKNKYKPFDDNFYYYDQCHIVGTDLEQPNEGCIAVIINKNTKWTEFSQGIFRFRKLNRGTYLKVFYVTNNEEKLEKSLTNNDILELLEKNETKFEKGQELGIKFQLLKAMVRQLSKNYLEDSLITEFLLSEAVTREDCIQFFSNNIKGINRVLSDAETNPYFKYIYDLYQDIIADKDLMQLIIGSQSIEKQIDMEIMENKDIQKLSVELVMYDDEITYQYDIITHLQCSQCIHTTSVPLFINDFSCSINGKPIYISLNIALGFNSDSIIDTTLLIFVELPDIILIEIEYVAYDYYSHKFPIYDFKGNLLNIFLKNNISPNPFKLDIDYRILYLFDITNYINPIKEKNQYIITRSDIVEIEDNLNMEAAKIIFFLNRKLPNTYANLFNVSPIVQYIVKRYVPDEVLRLVDIPEKDNNREHNPQFRLDDIFIHRTPNSNGIVLKTEVFPEIRRVPFQIIYDTYYHRLDTSLHSSQSHD